MLKAQLKHLAKRALGKPSVPPPVKGVADASWYDAAYTAIESYQEEYFKSHYYSLWCVITDRVRRNRLKRVVDIGCGPGQLAQCLFAMGDIDSYVGLDFSAKAIESRRSSSRADNTSSATRPRRRSNVTHLTTS